MPSFTELLSSLRGMPYLGKIAILLAFNAILWWMLWGKGGPDKSDEKDPASVMVKGTAVGSNVNQINAPSASNVSPVIIQNPVQSPTILGGSNTINYHKKIPDRELPAAFLSELSGVPKGKVQFWSQKGDNESRRFAEKMAVSFKESGFAVDPFIGWFDWFSQSSNMGVLLRIKDQNQRPAHLEGLYNAFARIGLNPQATVGLAEDNDTIIIEVRSRPEEP
jgi:hypothetical protein